MPEALNSTTAVPRAPGSEKKENVSGSAGSEGVDLNIDFFQRARATEGDTVPDNDPMNLGSDSLELDITSGNAPLEGRENEDEGDESDDDAGGEDSGDEDDDVESEGEEEDEDEGSDEEEGDEEDEKDGEELSDDVEGGDKAEVKKSKVKIGDKEYDVPNDATIPTKANGKMENPTLQDLKNAYASKSAIAAEVAESKKIREEAVAAKRRLVRENDTRAGEFAVKESKLATLTQAVKNRDFESVITQAAMLAGENAADFWDHIENTLLTPYYGGTGDKKGFAQLDATTRTALQLDRRNRLTQLQIQTMQQETVEKETNQKYAQFKQTINDKFGISEDEVLDCWDGFEQAAASGKLNAQQIQSLKSLSTEDKYKLAASEALANKNRSRISSVIEKKFNSLKSQALTIANELENTMGIDFVMKATDENLAELIRRVYSKNKKVATTGKSTDKLSDKATPRHSVKKGRTEDLGSSGGDDDDIYQQSLDKPSSQVWGHQFKV